MWTENLRTLHVICEYYNAWLFFCRREASRVRRCIQEDGIVTRSLLPLLLSFSSENATLLALYQQLDSLSWVYLYTIHHISFGKVIGNH